MFAVKLIVTDLDNTLLSSSKTISSYSTDVLNRCKKENIRIAFATARPERAVCRFITAIDPHYIISNNGATVTRGSTVLYNKKISPEISTDLLENFRDAEAITLISVEVGHCLYTNYKGPPWEDGWNPVYHDFSALIKDDVVKVSTECANIKIVQDIIAKYPELHLYANSGESWQQIMHRDATKLNAIKFIADDLKIDLTDVAAFGDDYNDIEMLSHCGIGIAVENAIPEAQKAANFTCGSNEADGIAHWLEANILRH